MPKPLTLILLVAFLGYAQGLEEECESSLMQVSRHSKQNESISEANKSLVAEMLKTAASAAQRLKALGKNATAHLAQDLVEAYQNGLLKSHEALLSQFKVEQSWPTEMGSCKDEALLASCLLYKRRGYCEKAPWWWQWHWPDWMEHNCAFTCGFCVPFSERSFSLKRIDNAMVANELVYATSASAAPKCVHGIYWMDQRGVSLPIPEDPGYKQEGRSAADELLVTFATADTYSPAWNPQTRCFTNAVYGGKKGHWTFMDRGNGTSDVFSSAYAGRLTIEFCFGSHIPVQTLCDLGSEIQLSMRVDVYAIFEGLQDEELDLLTQWLLSALEAAGFARDGYWVDVPHWIISLTMEKKTWGWDRVTTLGPSAIRSSLSQTVVDFLKLVLPAEFKEFFGDKSLVELTTFHYPVFQVIDGDGKKTKYFDAYLTWANNDTNCTESSFNCQLNRGNGTSLIGVLTP
eukprot:TRINITY_DN111046_c0_g1_i1.p1 TRINITY_DN111046_c0_g1~~TRINITY_DN111046_c0_g1_i1.p1  ORF type:complete len:459 (-),score=90.57 TRINITY_DN111046_c0_g1_i1:61-1437(-)